MRLGSEGPITAFFDGMEQLEEAVKTLTGMLNRYNRGRILLGVDSHGDVLGRSFCETDVGTVRETIGKSMNHVPDVRIQIGLTSDGEQYLSIEAEGYEIPYSYKSWFYSRRQCPGAEPGKEWVTLLTCGMRHH